MLLIIGAFALAGHGLGLMFALRIVASLAGTLAVFTGVASPAYKLLVDSRRTVLE